LKNNNNYKYAEINPSIPDFNDRSSSILYNKNLETNNQLTDMRIFPLYPNDIVVVALNQTVTGASTYSVDIYVSTINTSISKKYILNTTYSISKIVGVQFVSEYEVFVYVSTTSDNYIKQLLISQSSIPNVLSSRSVVYKQIFVEDNIVYLVGTEGGYTKLFVYIKGELLFEKNIESGDVSISYGDLYYIKNSSLTRVNPIDKFIGIYDISSNLIQISGTVPKFFTGNNSSLIKNVYFNEKRHIIDTQYSSYSKWIGIKTINQEDLFLN
jgi:hypothetical protein